MKGVVAERLLVFAIFVCIFAKVKICHCPQGCLHPIIDTHHFINYVDVHRHHVDIQIEGLGDLIIGLTSYYPGKYRLYPGCQIDFQYRLSNFSVFLIQQGTTLRTNIKNEMTCIPPAQFGHYRHRLFGVGRCGRGNMHWGNYTIPRVFQKSDCKYRT